MVPAAARRGGPAGSSPSAAQLDNGTLQACAEVHATVQACTELSAAVLSRRQHTGPPGPCTLISPGLHEAIKGVVVG